MSGKPQIARENEQEDFLEQIITQGLDKMKSSEQAAAAGDAPADETPSAPKQEDSETAASPASPEKKNRRSAVYLYLLILFGAAFLLLLLAFFSSETTISDLRNSMNLSREELLEEIKDMQERNAALIGSIDRLNDDLIQWQKRYEEKDQELNFLLIQINAAQEELYSLGSFLQLERYYLAEDYESCAALFLLLAQSEYGYVTPKGLEERQLEILNAVLARGLLDEEYYLHLEDYEDLLDAYFDKISETLDLAQSTWW